MKALLKGLVSFVVDVLIFNGLSQVMPMLTAIAIMLLVFTFGEQINGK